MLQMVSRLHSSFTIAQSPRIPISQHGQQPTQEVRIELQVLNTMSIRYLWRNISYYIFLLPNHRKFTHTHFIHFQFLSQNKNRNKANISILCISNHTSKTRIQNSANISIIYISDQISKARIETISQQVNGSKSRTHYHRFPENTSVTNLNDEDSVALIWLMDQNKCTVLINAWRSNNPFLNLKYMKTGPGVHYFEYWFSDKEHKHTTRKYIQNQITSILFRRESNRVPQASNRFTSIIQHQNMRKNREDSKKFKSTNSSTDIEHKHMEEIHSPIDKHNSVPEHAKGPGKLNYTLHRYVQQCIFWFKHSIIKKQ